MSAIRQRPGGAFGLVHPAVFERRMSDLMVTGMTALIPAGLALAITLGFHSIGLPGALAIIAGGVAIVALMLCTRLEISVTLILIYLMILEGPVKLLTSHREETRLLGDIAILAVCLGAAMRIVVQRQRIVLPPLSGWVIGWVVLVVVNAFNPKTQGILAVLAGFAQQLQFVPFFFFGYALMRNKRRFRQLFIVVCVAATASGLVAAYQTTLTPSQLSSWGPGYALLIHPEKGTGRVYYSEGEARVRPPGLGSEAGASGALGHVALPMGLALIALTRGRKKWIAILLTLGSILAVVVGLARLQLVGAGLGVLVFTGLAALAGRQFSRTMGAVLAIVVLAIPAGAIVVSSLHNGTFKRYESLGTSSSATYKENAYSKVPEYVAASPLGYGLGNSGSVSGIGGEKNVNLLEGHGLTSETEYNVLVKELGLPGLILWPLTAIYISLLIVRRIRSIRDPELAVCLAGAFASFLPLIIEGSSGFLSGGLAGGAYYWFAIGVAAYWLVGRKGKVPSPVRGRLDGAAVAA
ncbi:MAG: hypothetical protein ACYDHT_02880 [Solirubrobacteraceae bacterium]